MAFRALGAVPADAKPLAIDGGRILNFNTKGTKYHEEK